MRFEVKYLATDGEVRHRTVEADTKEEAEDKAWEDDAGGVGGGDNISRIICVSNA